MISKDPFERRTASLRRLQGKLDGTLALTAVALALTVAALVLTAVLVYAVFVLGKPL